MVKWEGIMDATLGHPPTPIWLSRPITNPTTTTTSATVIPSTTTTTTTTTPLSTGTSTDPNPNINTTTTTITNNNSNPATWKPLRKCDCRVLNERNREFQRIRDSNRTNPGSSDDTENAHPTNEPLNHYRPHHHLVYIDGGRKVLNLETRTMSPTYAPLSANNSSSSAIEEVEDAIWFVRYDYNNSLHKDVTMSTTTPSSSSNSSSSTMAQQQIEYKEDGTTVWSPYLLLPITNRTDAEKIESFYQEIVRVTSSSSSSFGTKTVGINQSILDQEIEIDGSYKVQVQYKNDTLSLRKVPNEKGWISSIVQFKPSFTLQRGYCPYTVVGEEMELALGPVRHVVFVIHGIGEALFHRTDIQITGMIQQTNQLRMILQKKQYQQWQKQCQAIAKKNSKKSSTVPEVLPPPPPNRIELIPVEWYHCLHGTSANSTTTATSTSTDDLMRNLQLVTLRTIPALRTIANDVLMDVLLYCTPTFCSIVLQTVTQQIIQYYRSLTEDVFPDFRANGGKVSMMGHSLGSVIMWDLLATAKQQRLWNDSINDHNNSKSNDSTTNTGTDRSSSSPTTNDPTASYGPSVIPPILDIIPFVPEYSILLGSPMGMFLSLRNATQLFHPDTISEGSDPTCISSFTLPTNHLYNIFHPSDPVAYRIEPLLLHPTSLSSSNIYSSLPEPVYLTVPGEDVRLHVKAMQFTNVVRKSLFSSSSHSHNSDHSKSRHKNTGGGNTATATISSWTSLLESAIANVSSSTQPLTNNGDDKNNENSTTDTKVPPTSTRDGSAATGNTNTATATDGTNYIRFPLGGRQNPRIDYCLQPLIVDNEYISAVTAHSSYFTNTDIQDFLIGILH